MKQLPTRIKKAKKTLMGIKNSDCKEHPAFAPMQRHTSPTQQDTP